ncbi:MAG: flagellar hook-associated protein FlgL [Micrococcales bacterium]|nr:flagellar hook-associated protein FlgL [Micrococcales bacterium]MCL2666128.1 flagellar hook-associated protein FlgL [Micrococcales bacterium]
MIGRVTSQTIARSTLANLQSNLSSVSKLQAQLSSGKKVTKASDDPVHSAQLMSLRGEQTRNSQYERNVQDSNSWLNTIDSALQTASSSLRRVRDLVIQGGNTSLPKIAKDALATEIRELKDGLLKTANTTYLGRSVFAGTSITDAFSGADAVDGLGNPAPYMWSGNDDGHVLRAVADTAEVRVDSNGRNVFGEGADSLFALLDEIATTLESGGNPADLLDRIDAFSTDIRAELASVGARQRTVENAATQLSDAGLNLTTQVSGIEDIDLAQVILQLQSQHVAYQASLGAASKALTPSLMEFLR